MSGRLRESMKRTLKSIAKNEQLKLIAEGKILQQEMNDQYNYNVLQNNPEILDRKVAREADYKARRSVAEDLALEEYLKKNPEMLDKIVAAELAKETRSKKAKEKKDQVVADAAAREAAAVANASNASRQEAAANAARAARARAALPPSRYLPQDAEQERRHPAPAGAIDVLGLPGGIFADATAQTAARMSDRRRAEIRAEVAEGEAEEERMIALAKAAADAAAIADAAMRTVAAPADAVAVPVAERGRPKERTEHASPRGRSVAPSARDRRETKLTDRGLPDMRFKENWKDGDPRKKKDTETAAAPTAAAPPTKRVVPVKKITKE